MNEDIIKIIKAGTMAPSGDNCQPWMFKIDKEIIEIYNVPERDQSLYNFRQNASMIAFGAVLENMNIMANDLGFNLQISLLPDVNNVNLVARCILKTASEKINDYLVNSIYKRVTNRKPYRNTLLNKEQVDNILLSTKELNGCDIKMVCDQEEKKSLAKFLSNNEKVVLENQGLHNFLFDHIRWSEEEERQKKDGFYIKTLELGVPETFAFKLLRYWSIAKFLNKFGIASKVASENAKIYKHSAAFIAFVMPDNNSENFIAAGRLMQRTWLKITSMNMSGQLLTGVTFIHQRILANAVDMFTDEQIKLIENSYKEVEKKFGINSGTIALILRIGEGGSPSATSSRLEPKIISNV